MEGEGTGAGPGSGSGAGGGSGGTAQGAGAAAGGRFAATGAREGGVFRGAFANGAKKPEASDWSKTVCPLPISEDFHIDLTQDSQSKFPSTLLFKRRKVALLNSTMLYSILSCCTPFSVVVLLYSHLSYWPRGIW